MHKTVYISSTYKDLTEYRDTLREMFSFKGLQEEYKLVGMEGYVSESGKRAIDVCLGDVRDADIYILILAKRYGSLVEDENISYTEAEYNEAYNLKQVRPDYSILIFYSEDGTEHIDFKNLKNLGNDNLANFYEKVKSQNACFIYPFTTPDNLCKQILITLNFNFRKLSSIDDYTDVLRLMNRNDQSYAFAKSLKVNSCSFYFSAVFDNSPGDFLDRLFEIEAGGKYKNCRIDLGQFMSINPQNFENTFIAEISRQWGSDRAGYEFETREKLFLSVQINSVEINNEQKLGYLHNVLAKFLPRFLAAATESTTNDKIFFIFYTCRQHESETNGRFQKFIEQLEKAIDPYRLTLMNSLADITRIDTKNWLNKFVRHKIIDEDELSNILGNDEDPFKKFTMREVNRSIKTWIKKFIINNL